MSLILPALQSHDSDEDFSDNDEIEPVTSPKMTPDYDSSRTTKERAPDDEEEEEQKIKIESTPSVHEAENRQVVSFTNTTTLKPATYEPIPIQKSVTHYHESLPAQEQQLDSPTMNEQQEKNKQDIENNEQDEGTVPLEEDVTNKQQEEATTMLDKESKHENRDIPMELMITQKKHKTEDGNLATPAVLSVSIEESSSDKVNEDSIIATSPEDSQELDNRETTLDSGISLSQLNRSSNDTDMTITDLNEETTTSFNHLASILPAVKESIENTIITERKSIIMQVKEQDNGLSPEDMERAKRSREFEYPIEDPIDLDMFRDNMIAIQAIDTKNIPPNNLKPHEQEKADETVREGMSYLFDNKFMKAKSLFQTKAGIDPLYALGLGAMGFIKAVMTYHEADMETAMNALATAYTIAKAQINNTSFKKPFKDTFSQYFTTLLSSNNTGLPTNPPLTSMPNSSGGIASPNAFIPNGVLRAHVIKAECCLLMSILQMTQESVVGYLKCGLNIRRAYNSYSIVWQEYKRMGQEYMKYMDPDTISGIQFGIGAVHLILSSMPAKILKIFSFLGWKSDKQLGFALLKLCLEGRGIRAPLAALTLLAYYSILTSFAPQLYSKEMMAPAIECLLDAQTHHPNSCFFLFFAARIARVARNLPLSIQSFTFAAESSHGEWIEVAMKQNADYEIGFNLALQLNWKSAARYFEQLSHENYWSPAFSKYFVGACYEMLGQRSEAILAFAEVSQLAERKKMSYIDAYVLKKVDLFQRSGYQDLDFILPGLEILLVMNAFGYLERENLEICLTKVQNTLEKIYEREKMEYMVRLRELVPTTDPPNYYDQRAILLLIKASILNSLDRHEETIVHLNWILDHKDRIENEKWVIPFTYWESGVTSWGMGKYKKSRKLWQLAMTSTKYDFEYRMAVRLSLALGKCDEMGVPHIEEEDMKGSMTIGRKRMPILNS
ncbi:uncharacterized protein BX663DRAFT_506584 [Cokeromyces recurvatus]|uniref:uncharacterized protein n=1 Tax=Cokeromyces recurvatus TaxID=90255 RepID=UPI00221FE00B|nr:uncharacterized protein BX663DRAFT_506584 [Cokeromyces recurvatus]KAI7903462.1 hypothetical protein BX663DRAFT_506584 [Cokeromyces recurvatus]